MKFALALTAATAFAAEATCWEGTECVSWWYDEAGCDGIWWGYDDCFPEDDGWYFADDCDYWWMWAEDYYPYEESCQNIYDYWYGTGDDWSDCYSDWIWEDCSWSYY